MIRKNIHPDEPGGTSLLRGIIYFQIPSSVGIGSCCSYTGIVGQSPKKKKPGISPEAIHLIQQMANANRLWGAEGIWGQAQSLPELVEHLEWLRAYYHFVRDQESLAVELANPVQRKGKQPFPRLLLS